MQYELRQQVIEPRRSTFTHLVRRYGDRPATRYEEASVGIQPTENFHYRPLWDPAHKIYDVTYSALRLTDPYSFLDPRQYYYTPYVSNRAALHEAFGKTLDYVVNRDLLAKLDDGWKSFIGDVLLPLRHYEAGAQLILVNGARFAYGSTVEQCLSYAAFDRIGNAQMISRIGIAFAANTDAALGPAKQQWLDEPGLQGLRKLIEELLIEPDWAIGEFVLDLADQLIFPLLTGALDEAALLGGAGAYSLLTQHLAAWFTDNRRWVDALNAAWLNDPETADANRAVLTDVTARRLPEVLEAVTALARTVDDRVPAGAVAAVTAGAADLTERLAKLGVSVRIGESA